MKSLNQQIKEWTNNVAKQIEKEMNKKTIRVKCRYEDNDMGFSYLDDGSRKVLQELVDRNESSYFLITNQNYPLDIIQDLEDKGYIKTNKQGIQTYIGGDFVAVIMVTRDGKCYDELKEKYESRKQTGSQTFNAPVTNIEGGIHDSTVQIATKNSNIEITNELTDEVLKEISDKIETYGLSVDNKQELKDLVEDVKEKQQKKPNLVKRGLKAIWDFAKDVGCGVLAAYISNKCGF